MDSVTLIHGPAAGTVIRSLGDGPDLVVLHGGGVTSREYERLAAALGSAFRVHLYDRRGRPGAPPLAPDHTIEADVADLQAVLEHTGATRVFGHSGGAFIAMQAALRLPLTRIAVYDPGISVDHTVSADWLPDFRAALRAGDEARAMALAGAGAQGGEGLAARLPMPVQVSICRAFLRTPIGARMRELLPTMATEVGLIAEHDAPATAYAGVQAEVLLAYGARSATYFRRTCEALASALPHARALRIPSAGHNAANIARSAFVRPFADFLAY
jgi:pimeloyl-ACP methyl ester carboxylesterase